MAKKLISEQTVLEASKRGEKIISASPDSIITDAARERARQLGIKLSSQSPDGKSPSAPSVGTVSSSGAKEVIAIGSDHGGFAVKEIMRPILEGLGYKVVDLGTYTDEACDYPDYAYAVARMVSLGQASRGIMIDAVGIASAIVANKIKGIRAACCFDEFSARSSREHNDANVLTLGGRTLGIELVKSITKVWLETNFGGGRHQKRIQKITEIENRNQG